MTGAGDLAVREMVLPLGGSELVCVRFGTGPRPLVLIPGLSLRPLKGTGHAMARMYRAFAGGYTVYVPDRKRDIRPGYTVRDIAADTAAAMDALGLADADMLGISQGGMIAQYLALERPELVRRLVLAVTLSRENPAIRDAVETWARLAGTGDYGGIVTDVMGRMYSKAYLERFGHLLPAISKMLGAADLDRFSVLTRACLTCDTYERLPEIKCPVFVIGARQDRIVTPEASEEMAARLGCGLYMYETLGHSAYEEAPDFNDRVLAFLRG